MHKTRGDEPEWGRAIIAALLVAAYPDFAFAAPGDVSLAAAGSVGAVFCSVFRNVGGMTFFISAVAYIVGASLAVRGVFDLIKRSSDPNKPLKDGLLGIMAGGMVAALPNLVEWLHRTIYKIPQYRAFGPCSPIETNKSTQVLPLDEMLYNFVQNISTPIIMMMSALAVIFGAAMIFYNMVKLSKFGTDAKSNTLTPIIGSLIIGAMLMALGQTMDVSLNTLFGGNITHGGKVAYTTIAYEPSGSFDMKRFNRAMEAVFIFLYIIGSLSFIRGFFILRNALEGSGQATKGQAFTHIIGGTLLVNMPNFIRVLETTIGFKIIA